MNDFLDCGASNVGALSVSQQTLADARDNARFVSRSLHQIESLAELDWEQLNALCRVSLQTEMLLQEMLCADTAAHSQGALSFFCNE